MLHFDPATLKLRLAALSPQARVAFGLACAERLARFSPRQPATRLYELSVASRELAAQYISGAHPDASTVESLVASLVASPHGDDDDLATCTYVLECMRSNDPQMAVWAAQRAYDARDTAAQSHVPGNAFTAGIEAAILNDSAVQTELSCQSADLAALMQDQNEAPNVVARAATVDANPHA